MAEYLGAQVLVPENDHPHREYLAEAGQGRLSMQKCADCGILRYPVRTHCPECRSMESSWEAVSGKGTIYSYYVVPHPINPAFRDFAPYVVILVELDEQRGEPTEHRALRMVGNLVEADGGPAPREDAAIGKRVEVTFIDIGDDWALPQWRLSDEAPESEPWQVPLSHPPDGS